MANFNDLIKKFPDGIFTTDTVKSALQKFAAEEKLAPTSSITDICKSLRDNDNKSIFQFLLHTKQIALLHILLPLLDKNRLKELQDLLLDTLFDAIKQSNVEAYALFISIVDPETLQNRQNEIRQFALRNSKYQMIMRVLNNKLNFDAKEELLLLAQNPHDIAYLIQQFHQNAIITARDSDDNNILHLALHNNNSNIFRYIINHYGSELLYKKNNSKMTPIDLVYHDIKTTAETKNTAPDFGRLMLLDQTGANLETEQYQDLYQHYHSQHELHQHFLLAKQPKPQKEVRAVSFNGGGAKGQAFMTAYREALQHGILQQDKVKQFGGTSAGAITAGIFAMGFDITRCIEELNKFDFKKLMNDPTTDSIRDVRATYEPRWVEYYLQGYYGYLIYDILATVATEKFALWGKQSLITAIQELLTTTTGLFKPTYLRDTLLDLIKERIKGSDLAAIDPAHITFKDFQDHPSIFGELVVYITNLTTGQPEKWSAADTPNIAIVDGIVTSASFPVFFEAPQKFEIITNAQGQRERKPVLLEGKAVFCCDGGVLKNDPVDAFDQGHFNEHTLTFLLVSSDAKNLYEHEKIDTVYNKSSNAIHVMSQLFKMMRSVERTQIHSDIRNQSRIIYIDTLHVGTLDFNNKQKNTPILEGAACDGVISYLNRRTANGYSALRHETISLLMSYGVAKFLTNGSGQAVQINPGKRLSPQQILRVYAAATDIEVIMLRSIINPNQRNHERINAMLLANNLIGYTNTIKRLKSAGAATVEEVKVDPSSIPSYFHRGEQFLQSHVNDEHLHALHELQTEKERQANELDATKAALSQATQHVHSLESQLHYTEKTGKEAQQQITQLNSLFKKTEAEKNRLEAAASLKDIEHGLEMKDMAIQLKLMKESLTKANEKNAILEAQIAAKPVAPLLVINEGSGLNTPNAFFATKSTGTRQEAANLSPAKKVIGKSVQSTQ